jgi:hypothetical protein
MQFDILISAETKEKPATMLSCLYDGAIAKGIDARIMRRYDPRPGAVLALYGLGAADRRAAAKIHSERGGHFVALDAGYWERKSEDRKFRVSIDGFHCPQLIMRGPDPGPDRLNASKVSMASMANPVGDIVLVGNGMKSNSVDSAGWTMAKSREIKQMHPKRRIVYRPKRQFIERGVVCDMTARDDKIERVLSGKSLVVCRHSNVAVDACRMGVPVVCEDGAAACIYPSRLEDEAKQPSAEKRAEFLRRLAWWQWSMPEMEKGLIWPWLTGVLNEIR